MQGGARVRGFLAVSYRRVTTVHRWFEDGLLRRIIKNAGLLLSMKSVAGVLGLIYLAVAANALGPQDFGNLILIHTYTVVVSGVAKFQSWQAVIRYGAECEDKNRNEDFQRLIKFTTLLDVVSALVAAVAAALAIPYLAPWLGWDADTANMAALYCVLIFFTITATPTGILRYFDRFDLLSLQIGVSPVLRLAGAIIALVMGAGLWAFVLAWFVAGVVASIVLIFMGWRELARRPHLMPRLRGPSGSLTKPHVGIWWFIWTTNLHTSIGLVKAQFSTFLVGLVLTPAAAGIYKIAVEFSSVVATPTTMLAQAIYPDLAKLAVQGTGREVGRLALRSGLVAGAAALAFLVIAVFFGEYILEVTVGAEYLGAYVVFIFLVLSAVITMFGFSLDPVMYAVGRPGVPLRINLLVTVLYVPLLVVLLLQVGVVGAGYALLAATVLTFIVMTTIASRHLLSHYHDCPTT